MLVLGIETSCDETALSVLRCSGKLQNPKFEILSDIVASQIALHAKFGGVVPNLAKREHLKNLPIVLGRALKRAKIKNPANSIDTIAVTVGPGLEPALWTGINFARELALAWKKPLIPINHMEGHIAAALLQKLKKTISFPALALLVSGGHTELVYIKKPLQYKMIGETLDDAAGEAFDKVARMLGLGYPGGPAIAKEAKRGLHATSYKLRVKLPRPMIRSQDFNFSFSGLKTAVLYLLRDFTQEGYNIKQLRPLIAREFQQAVIDVLITKTLRAAKIYKVKSIILGGGVSANRELRKQLSKTLESQLSNVQCHLSPLSFASDNAAMIAAAGYLHAIKGDVLRTKKELLSMKADATLSL